MTVVTRAEAMVILKVGRTKMYEMVRDGKISEIRRDGQTYFDQADLDAYWENLKQPKVKSIGIYDTVRKRRVKTG